MGLTKYQDMFPLMHYSASVGLGGALTSAGKDAVKRCCTGRGGCVKRASEVCAQVERNLKLTRAQTGEIGRGTTQELRKQPPPPLTSRRPSGGRERTGRVSKPVPPGGPYGTSSVQLNGRAPQNRRHYLIPRWPPQLQCRIVCLLPRRWRRVEQGDPCTWK